MNKIWNGMLTVKHYKEPLLRVPRKEGHGYFGALSMTLKGDKLQCHVCGKLFSDVALHSYQKHKMNADKYRERFQLAKETSLISEVEKERRKEQSLRYFYKLTPAQKIAQKEKMLKAYMKWRKKNPGAKRFKISLETKNKRGTCPDQLIAKIQEVAKKMNKVPTKHEFINECGSQRYMHLIYMTFGTWDEALKRAKLNKEPRKTTSLTGRRYSTDELLDYLSVFYQEHGRIPTDCDARRGWIPCGDIYRRRFGSLPEARRQANIPEFV